MLKNYIFDLGGVILDIRMQNAYEQFMALGLSAAELEKGGSVYKWMEDYQLGLLNTQEFCQQIADKCSSTTEPLDIEQAWNSICLNIAERKLKALRRLRQRKGVTVSLLSNTNELHWKYCCQKWFNANGNNQADFFGHIFLSSICKSPTQEFSGQRSAHSTRTRPKQYSLTTMPKTSQPHHLADCRHSTPLPTSIG